MKTIVFSLLLTVVALPASAESPRIIITDWPGAYHADEVADVHDGEHWTGFVIEGDRWKAFDATVSVKTVKDVVVDRHNGRLTGKQVTSDPKALFLLKDVDIAARKGASYALPKDPLAIATSYTIKGEHDVMLLWQQGIFLDPETNKPQEAFRFLAEVDGNRVKLAEPSLEAESDPKLIWSGDINGDGYPDFVADFSIHSNEGEIALFLSKRDGDKVTYVKKATRMTTGC